MKHTLSMLFICILMGSFFVSAPYVSAEEVLEGIVVNVEEENITNDLGEDTQIQQLEIEITKGSIRGETIFIENGIFELAKKQKYTANDRLLITRDITGEGEDFFFIVDYVRRPVLGWLFVLFFVTVAVIGKTRGLMSLLGMALSFGVVFYFILPRILDGAEPISTAILGSMVIIPLTFFLSHGFKEKTVIAVIGTFIALVITGILATVFVQSAQLTGYSEEAMFVQVSKGGILNLQGLLLAGIIIGLMGILDDITISQASIVEQLKGVNPKISFHELFSRAMVVGRDHISSLVNTLILVYTGASLPLLLLFLDASRTIGEVVNYESVAEEIVRTLVGSIGLIIAVPITTLLACLYFQKHIPEKSDQIVCCH